MRRLKLHLRDGTGPSNREIFGVQSVTFTAILMMLSGPYSSLASVTVMTARQLKREITKRDAVHQLP